MVNFNKFCQNIHLTYKHEFLIDDKNDYIKTFLIGNFKNKLYLVVARINGLIQLYERVDSKYSDCESDYEYDQDHDHDYHHDNIHDHNEIEDSIKYQLFKEWKNSNIDDQDQLLSVGFINNQYLYSCSIGGKLIIRDLINDDANQSYKVYFIANCISCIEINYMNHEFVIAISSKNQQLRLYKIINRDDDDVENNNIITTNEENNHHHHNNNNNDNNITNFDNNATIRGLPERLSHFSRSSRKSTNLIPYYLSSNESKGINDWICSLVIDDNRIYCGTQFGNLIIYNLSNFKLVYQIQISRFKLNIAKFDNYLIFNDSMTKLGIFDCSKLKIESSFSLNFGPIQYIQFYWNNINTPIYFIVSTLNQDLHFYKLFDDKIELLINLSNLNSSIPCFCVLNYNYQLFDWFFNNGNTKSCPKRKCNRLPNSIKKKKITIDHKEEEEQEEEKENADDDEGNHTSKDDGKQELPK